MSSITTPPTDRASSTDPGSRPATPHQGEEHHHHTGARLNALRAGVLGANDGVVSLSGLVIGVAAAGASTGTLLTTGLAGIAAGALSMAAGEYVSVSTQRDTEKALLAKERRELEEMPDQELEELAGIYRGRGLSPELAHRVAVELTAHDALAAHAEAELGIDDEEFTSPWHAAAASMGSFTLGSLVPTLAIVLVHGHAGIIATVVAAALALLVTGWVSARLGDAPARAAVVRNVVWGLAAMAVTYGIGRLVGTQV